MVLSMIGGELRRWRRFVAVDHSFDMVLRAAGLTLEEDSDIAFKSS